jgi:hypothetical protein
MKTDLKQDKKLVKKAVMQHEKAKHPGKTSTALKLKKGGKIKKK